MSNQNPTSSSPDQRPKANRDVWPSTPPSSQKTISSITPPPSRPFYSRLTNESLSGYIIFFGVLVTLVTMFFLVTTNQSPLFPLTPVPQSQITNSPLTVTTPEPKFIIFGQYKNTTYAFKRGDDAIYSYDNVAFGKDYITNTVNFTQYSWHSGKLLLVSDQENVLGNIYLYNLTNQQAITFNIVTNRETPPNFPRTLQIEANTNLAWSDTGNIIAFTARDINTHKVTLFLYEIAANNLIYTPAKEMDDISSVQWLGDSVIFVATNDTQEDFYRVDKTGGGFQKWQ